MRWCALAAVGLSMAPGCGPRAFIDVSVESDYEIPVEVDSLTITVESRRDDRLEGLETYSLVGEAFPVRVILVPEAATRRKLRVSTRLELGSPAQTVAEVISEIAWQDDTVNDLVVRIYSE